MAAISLALLQAGTPGWVDWVLFSDGGLLARVAVGVTILAMIAIADLRKHGRNATRWREHLFLAVAAMVAMGYGIVNDQITSLISWEFWWYGKGMEAGNAGGSAGSVGIQAMQALPAAGFHWQVLRYSLGAAWTVGLLVGVVLLFANNPTKLRAAPLPQIRLYRMLPLLLAGPLIASALLGTAGFCGWLNWLPAMRGIPTEWRPARFACVYGIHIGAYIGGGIVAIAAAVWIWRKRRI